MTVTNHANRLAEILTRFKTYADDVKMKSIWAQEFGIDIGALDKIAMAQVKLISLTYKIENGINSLSNLSRKDLYLTPIGETRKLLFNLTVIHDASNVKAMFPQAMIDNLYVISDILNSNNINESIVTNDKFMVIVDKINELVDEISESDLEIDDKDFLLKLLAIVKNSLSEYNIDGIASLKEAVEIGLGMIMREKFVLKNESGSVEKTSYYKKTIDVVKDVNAMYTLATNTVAALPEAFDKLVGFLK